MGNWAVTYRYKPNPYIDSNHTYMEYYDNIEKKYVESVLRGVHRRYGEYIEILEIVRADTMKRRILKEKAKVR